MLLRRHYGAEAECLNRKMLATLPRDMWDLILPERICFVHGRNALRASIHPRTGGYSASLLLV